MEVSLNMINKLLDKESNEHNIEEKETTIILVFISIIENHMINSSKETTNYKYELVNKEIVKKLNQLFNIRENYEELLKYAVDNISVAIKEIDFNFYKNYIESLFGYKTKIQLLDIIRKKFDSNAEIKTDAGDVSIKFKTVDIVKFFKLDPLAINEIRNYYKNQNIVLNSINIEIINVKNDYPTTANPIQKIVYEIDQNGLYIKKMKYRDGRTMDSKKERI